MKNEFWVIGFGDFGIDFMEVKNVVLFYICLEVYKIGYGFFSFGII